MSSRPSEKGLDVQTREEAPQRDSDPHQFLEFPNGKHPGGFWFPDATRSLAFGQLRSDRRVTTHCRKSRLLSITLLGQEPNFSAGRVSIPGSKLNQPQANLHRFIYPAHVLPGKPAQPLLEPPPVY